MVPQDLITGEKEDPGRDITKTAEISMLFKVL